jgi:hypothetical chaperone protein
MADTFGLDFGTTNSALAISGEGGVRVIDADPFSTSSKTLRSILFFNKRRQVYVGQEAIIRYIEDDASGRLIQSVKTFLSDKLFDVTNINGRPLQLDDLISIIIKALKKRGETEVGHEVDTVVLGRPVMFSEDKEIDAFAEARLRSAAIKAGFKNVIFQFEPIAAALTFESSIEGSGERIALIGDFGGGTSDFTVIRLRGGNTSSGDRGQNVLSLGGVYIGGDVFDSRIMWHRLTRYYGRESRVKSLTGQWFEFPVHVFSMLCRWHLIPHLREGKQRESIRQLRNRSDEPDAVARLEDLIDQNFGFRLFQAIEKTKCELSSILASRIVFREGLTNINLPIVRVQFEEMVAEDLSRIGACVDQTVKDSGLTADAIDTVFITGGTSHVPSVRRILEARFGAEKIKVADAFTSVAYGLGITASHL